MINTMNIIVIILSRKKLFFCPASTGKHAVMVCLTIYLCCYGVFLQFIYEVDESDDKYYEHLIINTMNTIVIILSWKSFSSVQPALVNMLLWPLRKNLILPLITRSRTVMMMIIWAVWQCWSELQFLSKSIRSIFGQTTILNPKSHHLLSLGHKQWWRWTISSLELLIRIWDVNEAQMMKSLFLGVVSLYT